MLILQDFNPSGSSLSKCTVILVMLLKSKRDSQVDGTDTLQGPTNDLITSMVIFLILVDVDSSPDIVTGL